MTSRQTGAVQGVAFTYWLEQHPIGRGEVDL